jgi:hypothetical protein
MVNSQLSADDLSGSRPPGGGLLLRRKEAKLLRGPFKQDAQQHSIVG